MSCAQYLTSDNAETNYYHLSLKLMVLEQLPEQYSLELLAHLLSD